MHPNAPILPPLGKTKRRKSIMLRFLGFAFAAGGILFVVGASVAAYFLWQQEGCPHGRDQEYWHRAANLLRQGQRTG